MTNATLSPERIRECFDYDPLSGALTWRVRPAEHFRHPRNAVAFNLHVAGTVVGAPTHGYLRVTLWIRAQRFSLYAHRIAWCVAHGEWPAQILDHINGDGADNRLTNLRLATRQQNLRNVPVRSHNKLGVKGVRVNKFGRFVARMTVDKRHITLGTFKDLESAKRAFAAAAARVHGPFLHSSIAGAPK